MRMPRGQAGSGHLCFLAVRAPRRGAVLVIVLLCLLVIAIMAGVLLRLNLTDRSQVRAAEHRLQAEWLAESGLERAAARLTTAGDYRGETWDIPAAELGGNWAGRVTITVENVEEHSGQRLVKVQADYPAEITLRARQSKQAVVELGSRTSGERQ